MPPSSQLRTCLLSLYLFFSHINVAPLWPTRKHPDSNNYNEQRMLLVCKKVTSHRACHGRSQQNALRESHEPRSAPVENGQQIRNQQECPHLNGQYSLISHSTASMKFFSRVPQKNMGKR